MYRLMICFVALPIYLTSCTEQEGSDTEISRVLGKDGVLEVVSHASVPLPAPWILEPDLIIGVEYGEEEYMLRNPASFGILEDGTHVILDSSPSQIRIYDTEGHCIGEFGQSGEGPSDLPRSIYWSFVTPSDQDQFFIWRKYGTNRLQHWDTSGRLLSVHTLNQLHPLAPPAIIDGWDGTYYFGRLLRQRDPGSGSPLDLIRTNLEGTHTDTLFFLDYGQIPITCSMIEAELGMSLMSDPLITSDGRLCIGAAYEDWVRVIDPETSKETLRFRWDHVADVIPDTLISHYRGQMALGMDMEAGARWLHEHLSIVQLIEGVQGEIWVQRRPRPEVDGSWVVDVFDNEGVYRGRINVPIPPSRMKPFGEYMYGFGLNGEAPALIRYRLTTTVP